MLFSGKDYTRKSRLSIVIFHHFVGHAVASVSVQPRLYLKHLNTAYMLNMIMDGADTDRKVHSNLLIAIALCNQFKNLFFALCELLWLSHIGTPSSTIFYTLSL
ncbi:MAG: hypothetical protein GFH27_549289n91 [Chloroflexi bacterium AL-W]|nr:hypothetical protein [Chloroflexi bacterium AL-N1]NOK66823.1 hypothetical protein [Chloroflexi bacterium AL-N10]NOK74885.1 hypothetical protein [Chloroflexi bacterium AL-N5]NOK81426.1 hypothetical protein [Chloroflexi bacterium AL-W]NOK88895.1 hypothetical protein [Chloroflexi bacterium AL-N15]